MGPLTFCSSCGAELSKSAKIIAEMKKTKLKDIELEELLSADEQTLMKNTLFEIMNELQLGLCCRMMLCSHIDITNQIYN